MHRVVRGFPTIRDTASKNGQGRVTEKLRTTARSSRWILAAAMFTVVAFMALAISNGVVFNNDDDTTGTTPSTIARPKLPGDSDTGSTVGGVSARCKDGTYSFKAGEEKVSDDELCKNNGGVEQRLR
jgi:hypothetical protein